MSEVKRQAARWWSRFLKDQGKKEAFELALIRLLPDGGWELYNDYDPWDILLQAVQQAGIECRGFFFSGSDVGFPEKTGLRYRDGVLEAKEGYAKAYAPLEQQASHD